MPPKFVPRQRKQKARQRTAHKNAQLASSSESNAVELIPTSKVERDERRQKLREELRAQQPLSKASSKKNKRLEKYIDVKLKKEENLELLKKLASQQKVDTTLLQSSKKLGRGHESKRERLGRAMREQRAGIGGQDNEDILLERRVLPETDDEEVDIEYEIHEKEHDQDNSAKSGSRSREFFDAPAPVEESTPSSSLFGAGLKRQLETDEAGNPIIKKRKRMGLKPKGWTVPTTKIPQEVEWEGFSSELENADSPPESINGDRDDSDDNSDNGSSHDEESSDDDATSNSTDESESDENTESSNDEQAAIGKIEQLKERSSAFKEWATQQRNDALGFVPSRPIDVLPTSIGASLPESISERFQNNISTDGTKSMQAANALAVTDFNLETSSGTARKVFNVVVARSDDIQESRLALPVVAEEQKIMEAIHNHDIVVVWGATGSGKTTQIPQFLFEAGYGSSESPTPGMIGVTQPRRVAAVSMAKRVSTELTNFKHKVAYQIRFDSTVSKDTAIKFMTDGVLLREISTDFTLSRYSAIVLDEAHERSINTDLLIGMLSRIVVTRSELARTTSKYSRLKLVIMSATLRTADLTRNKTLFRNTQPPIVQAEGRQYPVTIHFARRTNRDYLNEAFAKVSRGHKKLPQGGILVFLTGQNEIITLAKRLKQAFPSTEGDIKTHSQVRISAADASIEEEDVELNGHSRKEDDGSDSETEIRGLDNDEDKEFEIGEDQEERLKVHVLPLYSQLPTDQQMQIFQPPPDGSRLIVLATNVAETSLTIPGIRYVFDCGRAKEKQYNRTTGVQSFEVGWISKASASQRTGRAGRTAPGHCYRLYSSAVYERDFAEFPVPEISRVPLEGVVLQLKSMGIPNVATFPFPTPPERESLLKAERLLQYLGALFDGKVTAIGKDLSTYPLSPRLSRILCVAQANGVIEYAIAIVAAMTVADIFIPENQLDLKDPEITEETTHWTEADNYEAQLREKRRKEYNSFHGRMSRLDRTSDVIKLLTTICDFTHNISTDKEAFYKFTRIKAINEIIQLRSQLTVIVATHRPGSVSNSPPAEIPEPTKSQIKLLRQIVAAGYIDQVAIRADLSPTPPETSRKPKRAIDVPYITLFPSALPEEKALDDADPKTTFLTKYVYIHPSSVLAHTGPDKLPDYLIYSHLSRSTASVAMSTKPIKTRLHPLTSVTAPQLVTLAEGTPLLEDGKPVGKIDVLDRDMEGRERRACWLVPFLKGEGGGMGWPLPPARRIVQVRVVGKGWVGEPGRA